MPKLFTYGTLMTGMEYHDMMYGDEFQGTATIVDSGLLMIDSAGIPALIESDKPLHRIVGEVYEVSDEKLVDTDRFEGDAGYERRTVAISDNPTVYEAFVYVLTDLRPKYLGPPIESGDYRAHCAAKRKAYA